jgi:hypothetical protein
LPDGDAGLVKMRVVNGDDKTMDVVVWPYMLSFPISDSKWAMEDTAAFEVPDYCCSPSGLRRFGAGERYNYSDGR